MAIATEARWWRSIGAGAVRLPEAFVNVLAASVVMGGAAAALGLRPLGHPWGSRVFLLLLIVVAVCSLRLPRQGEAQEHGVGAHLVPGVLLAAYAVLARVVLTPAQRVEWFLGGDHVRHLIFVAEEQSEGSLSYLHQSYPRAWHTLVTAVWTATGGRPDGSGLASLIDVMSTATWFLPGLLSLATGTLCLSLGRQQGLPVRSAALAALGAALAVLLPPFLSVYQALGFESSLVAAVAVAVAARLMIVPPTMSALVTSCAAVVVIAHTWQLLLPVAGLPMILVVARLVRLQRARALPMVVIAVVLLTSAAATFWGVFGVATSVGVGHATDSDIMAPYPLALLLLGVMAAAGLGLRRARGWSRLALPVVVVLPALTAVGLAVVLRIGLGQYYPSKLLWQSAALGLAPLGVALALALQGPATPAAMRVRALRMLTNSALVIVGVYAALSPLGAFTGAWSTVDGPRSLSAITSPRAREAQVVWLGSNGDDTISRILLDFYRAGRTDERTPQEPQDIAGDCRLLEAAKSPAVLSDRPVDAVRRRYRCVQQVQVVRVP